MSGFFKLLKVQTKVALRNKQIALCYYIIPFVFFLIFGAVLTKMDPNAKMGLPVSMVIFAISMGTFLGLSENINSLMREEYFKAFYVMNVKTYKAILAEQVSCGFHMLIQSLIVIVFSNLLFDSDLLFRDPKSIMALFLFLVFTVLGGSIVGLAARGKNIVMVTGQLCFFIIVFLGGIMFPSSYLPEALKKVAALIPASMVIEIRDSVDSHGYFKLITAIAVTLVAYIIIYRIKINSDKA